MSTKFSCREDEILINLVKRHPALYNYKLKSYKDIILKTSIWGGIAEELGKTENDCKARWKNIRDYYKRKRNETVKEMGRGLQSQDSDFFQKYKHLSFLENIADVERKTVNDVAEVQDAKNISKSADNTEESLFCEAMLPQTSEATTVSTETPKDAKRTCASIKSSSQETQEPKVRKKRPSNERIQELYKSQTTQFQEDPAITMFFQSIAATVSKFTPQLQVKAKVAIMKIMAQLELDNISQRPSHNCVANFSTSSFSRSPSSADSCSVSSDLSNSYSQPSSNSSTNLESQFSRNDTI